MSTTLCLNQSAPSEDSSVSGEFWMGYLILIGILCPTIIFGNVLVLLPFLKNPRVRTPGNQLVLFLAISDILLGITVPILNVEESEINQREWYYRIPDSIILLGEVSGLFFMVSIAVDKALGLAKPLNYANIATFKHINFFGFGVWLLSLGLGVVRLFFCPLELRLPLLGIAIIPGSALASACYLYVYTVARSHAKAIRRTKVVGVRCKNEEIIHFTVPPDRSPKRTPSLFSKYGYTLSVTVILLLGSRVPGPIIDFYFPDYQGWRSKHVHLIPVFLCSAFNPWVYAFHNGELKSSILRLIKCKNVKAIPGHQSRLKIPNTQIKLTPQVKPEQNFAYICPKKFNINLNKSSQV